MNPLTFPNIEVALADALADALTKHGAAVPVVLAVPATRPARFVRITRVGGSAANRIIDRARLVAECWDTSGLGAADLAALTRALITAAAPGYLGPGPELVWIDRVVDLGMAYLPDPDTNIPRYLVTAEVYATGKPLS